MAHRVFRDHCLVSKVYYIVKSCSSRFDRLEPTAGFPIKRKAARRHHGERVMRLLFVEDDSGTARFVERGLKEEGFSVDLAPDGEAGLHLALSEAYDAAIIDIMLPKLDGIELIERAILWGENSAGNTK